MKYFKMTFINLAINDGYEYGYGVWREGDGINYLPTDDYTVENITKEEYLIGCEEANVYAQAKEKEEKKIALKEKIYIREQIKEDKSKFERELNELTKETKK